MNILFDFERFPRIETPRLLLREIRREDAEAVFRLFSDPEVMRYYDMDVFTSMEQAQALIERQRQRFEQKEHFRWGLALKGSDTIIGTGGMLPGTVCGIMPNSAMILPGPIGDRV